jgi:Golgi phosphoprotein 3
MNTPELHLHEEVLLLALDDEKGSVLGGTMWRQAAGGAIVAELLLEGRIRATEEKKPKLEVVDATPLGDPVLDEVLAEMAEAKKLRKGADWVRRLGTRSKLKERIAAELVRKKVLRQEQGKILWIFDTTRYPERDGRPEKEVVARLKKAIFTATGEVAPRTVVLVALADASGLLKKIFEKSRLKERKERIKKLTEGQATGAMTREAIQAMQAAVMVCCIIPSVVVASSAT